VGTKQVLLMAIVLMLAFGSVPLALAAPSAASPTGDQVAAIESVIQKGNQEQMQAVATNDPTVMQDTATASFYQESVQTLHDLLGSGVTSIHLDNLQWGPIGLEDATTARAMTTETWSTTLADGSSVQTTDTNYYTLVLQDGAWKVQDDMHPDSNAQQV
jgi:hypothetical protein